MMVMKGGVVSESQDIRIAKFTNEVCFSLLSEMIDADSRVRWLRKRSMRTPN